MSTPQNRTNEGHPARAADRAPLRTGLLWLSLAVSSLSLIGCSEDPPANDHLIELSGSTMGTSYHIKIASSREASPKDLGVDALQREIDQRLEQINATMSTYRPDSDLSRFNAYAGTDWFPVPAAVVEVVEAAQIIAAMSEGMFDITVGPLVDLWGFGPAERRAAPPDTEQLEAALDPVGYRKLEVRVEPPALRKRVAGLSLDLSAIAKGYAVDQIAEQLERQGISDYLVEIGGELRAQGRKSLDRPWRVAVERPDPKGRFVQTIVELQDRAMATSGDYRNFFEHNGQRYSHTIDPRSGQPVRHRLASVTVLADDCMSADGLATALLAMGDQAGPALAESHEVAALFIIRGADGFEQLTTSGFGIRPAGGTQTR